MRAMIRCSMPCATNRDSPGCWRALDSTRSHRERLLMKTITMTVAVLLATLLMTACGKKESAAPAETAPAATAAPAEAAPAATSAAPANDEDASQTGGDKVAPRSNDAPPPPSN